VTCLVAVDGVGFRAEDGAGGQPPGPENLTNYNGLKTTGPAVLIFSGVRGHGGDQGLWLGSFTEIKARQH